MKRILCLILAFFSLTNLGNAQSFASNPEKNNEEKAVEVLNLAIKNIYKKPISPEQIKAMFLSTKGTILVESIIEIEGEKETKNTSSRVNIEESISVDLLDKIKQVVVTNDSGRDPLENFSKVTITSNGENIYYNTETVSNGKTLNLETMLNSPDIPESTKKQIRAQQENAKKSITPQSLIKGLNSKIFPILLFNPWEKSSFTYVGRAVADNSTAHIIELANTNNRITRYFFDDKTHLLLMMTDEVNRAQATIKTTYYFSNYKTVNGLSVAHKINSEVVSKVKQKVGEKNITSSSKVFSEVIIKSFQINPSFDSSTFLVKNTE
jgi:hypothetical protein